MDEAAFRKLILTNPADGTLRLVLADWLEERGDPRGRWLRAAAAVLAGPHFPAEPGPWPDWSPLTGTHTRLAVTCGPAPYPLAELRCHGGNRAVRLLAALALRDRLDSGPVPGDSRKVEVLRRAAAVAELFACGLASESDRRQIKEALGPAPLGLPAAEPHAFSCLVRAAPLALRQWSCCGSMLELLMSSARLRIRWRGSGVRADDRERADDRDRMAAVRWRQLALAEGLAVAVGRWPDCRHPSPRQRAVSEGCDHDQGKAYQRRPFGRRCARCGHYIGRPSAGRE